MKVPPVKLNDPATVRFAFAVLVFIAAAHAQTVAGVVRGVIADPSGGHVPGATITLTSRETGARRSTASDARGEFTITAVPPGEYRLEAESPGFKKHARTLTMEVDREVRLEIVDRLSWRPRHAGARS